MDHLHELEAVLCLEAADRPALARVPPEIAEVHERVLAIGAAKRYGRHVGGVRRGPVLGVLQPFQSETGEREIAPGERLQGAQALEQSRLLHHLDVGAAQMADRGGIGARVGKAMNGIAIDDEQVGCAGEAGDMDDPLVLGDGGRHENALDDALYPGRCAIERIPGHQAGDVEEQSCRHVARGEI